MATIRKILVPVDFSVLTDKVLDAAITMAQQFGAELRLVFVVEGMTPYAWMSAPNISFDVLEQEMDKSADAKLEKLVLEKLPKDLSCSTEVRKGSPSVEIVNCAREQESSLIIMGTHGYGGIEKMLLGSVADHVLKTAPCPVLVVR